VSSDDATAGGGTGPGGTTGPPWRAWRVGQRVVVRRRQPPDEPQPYTDVLGDLVAVDDAGVTVRTRRAGDVRVPGAEIALGKVVPPAPERRPRR
jgi:hypothetical protein